MTWFDFCWALVMPPALNWFIRSAIRLLGQRPDFSFAATWAVQAAGAAVITAAEGGWPIAAGFTASALVALLIWHNRRRRRKRSLAALGSKARAIRDALVRTLRETAKPSPVRRPALEGAS